MTSNKDGQFRGDGKFDRKRKDCFSQFETVLTSHPNSQSYITILPVYHSQEGDRHPENYFGFNRSDGIRSTI